MREVKNDYHAISADLVLCKKKNIEMHEKLLQMDLYIQRENLKVSGIDEDKNESRSSTHKKIRAFLVNSLDMSDGASIPIQRCHRIGAKLPNKPRDIIIRFLKIEKLFHALKDKNLISHINVDIRADPNENYNILSNILTLDKCIPCKKVRYNKYEHKNSQWITSGILKSIRFRDRLYQKVKKTSHDSNKFRVLKENLKVYNQVLKKAIRQIKFNYYSNTFEKYKNNTKKTWETINNITGKKHKD